MLALALAAARCSPPPRRRPRARDQLTILQDDSSSLGSNGERRDATLDEWKALGVDIVKMRVDWRDISPDEKPADPTDPAAYQRRRVAALRPRHPRRPGARHAGLPDARRPRAQLGQRARAPRACPAASTGRTPTLFEQFVQAAGTRYSGSYTPPPGEYSDPLPLPRVTIWSIWNEPNLVSWLSPQKRRRRSIYRNLLYGGLRRPERTGHGGDTILYGELLPFARGNTTAGVRRRPLAFLREMACVDRRYRAYTRLAARRKRGCATSARCPARRRPPPVHARRRPARQVAPQGRRVDRRAQPR